MHLYANHIITHIKNFLSSLWSAVLFLFSQKITWLVIGLITLFFIIKKCWSWYKQKQGESLVYRANKEIKKHTKGENFLLKRWIERLYYPSWASVITVVFTTVILFILAHVTIPHMQM